MPAAQTETVILDGRSLTPAGVEEVARSGAPVRLDDSARERNAAAARALAEMLDRDEPVYGVTTGVGGLRSREIGEAERPGQQLRLLRSHACGAGPLLSAERVRAAMVVRANQLGAGGAGVSGELLDALVDALNSGLAPSVHELGSLGTGDLTALAEIALALLAEGELQLGPRDGLAFMSSNAVAIGHAALVAAQAGRVLDASLRVAAVSFMAATADPVVLDERVHAARPHDGQVAVAARMRELLGVQSGARRAPADGPVQDSYAFRALPQVNGPAHDALAALGRVLAVELNAAAENALIDAAAPAALPNANFHAAPLALALDGLRAALAQSVSLTAVRVTALLDVMGLPGELAEDPGPSSGAMMLEYTAHSAAATVRALAGPVSNQATTVGLGVESHASFAPLAARMAEDALDHAAVAVATELAVAVRALRMRGTEPAGTPADGLFGEAAARLDPDLADRPLGEDVEAAHELLFGEATSTSG